MRFIKKKVLSDTQKEEPFLLRQYTTPFYYTRKTGSDFSLNICACEAH